MMSPGSRVIPAEMTRISSGTSKIRSETEAFWRGSPLIVLDTSSAARSPTSSARDRPGPHRTVGVQRLPEQPLLVVALDVAGGDVVDDRVAPHVIERVVVGDAAPALADDHRQLGLVVQLGRHRRMRLDVVVRTGHRGGGLREHDRLVREVLGPVRAVVARAPELADVLPVVLADREQVSPGHRDGGAQRGFPRPAAGRGHRRSAGPAGPSPR